MIGPLGVKVPAEAPLTATWSEPAALPGVKTMLSLPAVLFVRMALNAVRMKKKVVLVLEKVSELERILAVAKARGVRPLLGMRAKLYARGSGKWAKSHCGACERW